MPALYKAICALTPIFQGDSTLGTVEAPTLNRYLDGPKPGGAIYPWGNRGTNDTNPYNTREIPNTGITRQYHWNVTNTTMSPDGVLTPMVRARKISECPHAER